MLENLNQPRRYDVVLGGKAPPPLSGAVLGGLAGVKHRLKSHVAQYRLAALTEALNYKDAGFELVIQALDDEVEQVRDTACILLQGKLAKLTLLKTDAATWNKWREHSIRLEEGVNVNLSGLNLGGFNLSGFNLSSVNLIGANLCGAKLMGANLWGANLSEVNLKEADLSEANLTAALLYKANLAGANLTDANLMGANLQRANLNGSNVEGATFQRAIMPDGIIHD
ncbi:MAG TPA: pentapeptide repeat-containing protein [Leptolyngbyaceae cyanobacterium]